MKILHRITEGVVTAVMVAIALSAIYVFSVVVLSSKAHAAWEDAAGCSTMLEAVGTKEWAKIEEGWSEDHRDYVVRYGMVDGLSKTEEHHMVLPRSQWKDEQTPSYYEPIMSLWIDWDGDGVFSEFYLFPRGTAQCPDALHFIWNESISAFSLYSKGKERTYERLSEPEGSLGDEEAPATSLPSNPDSVGGAGI